MLYLEAKVGSLDQCHQLLDCAFGRHSGGYTALVTCQISSFFNMIIFKLISTSPIKQRSWLIIRIYSRVAH